MGQLSTGTNENNVLLNDMKHEIEKIPNYLTKQNPSFQQMVQQMQYKITTTVTTNKIEELRQIAILIYKIMVIQTYYLQWSTYLKAGLGQLMVPNNEQRLSLTNVPIWPKVIKKLLPLKDNDKSNGNKFYLNFVHQQLSELNHQLEQYQMALNIKTNNFHGYTLTIQKFIEKYIEQHLQSFRMQIEHEIDLIRYDYHIQALKSEYLRYHPNVYQVCLYHRLILSIEQLNI